MTTPRLITHRPDLLRLPAWEWFRSPDADHRLTAWLDVSHAVGDDWHHPEFVLIDVQCLDLLEVLYGPRAGFTVATGAGPADTAAMIAAQDAHRIEFGVDVTHPAGLSALRSILWRYTAGGSRPPMPHRQARPRLRVLPGGAQARPGAGA